MRFLTEARHQRMFCTARVKNWQFKAIISGNKAKFAIFNLGKNSDILPYFQMSHPDHKTRGDEETV